MLIRILRFREVLKEHDRTPEDQAIRNFEADRAAEREIRTWEQIAYQYRTRLEAQPKMTAEQRRALFTELLMGTFAI